MKVCFRKLFAAYEYKNYAENQENNSYDRQSDGTA